MAKGGKEGDGRNDDTSRREAAAATADSMSTADNKLPEELRGKGADVSARDLNELEQMQDRNSVQLAAFHLRLKRSDPEQVVRQGRAACLLVPPASPTLEPFCPGHLT